MTLELNPIELGRLNNLLGEIPLKYALPIVQLIAQCQERRRKMEDDKATGAQAGGAG